MLRSFANRAKNLRRACWRPTSPRRRRHRCHQRHPARSPISKVRRSRFCRRQSSAVLLERAAQGGRSERGRYCELVELAGDEDAGDAFLMQEVDAAVTWEPWSDPGQECPAWPSAGRQLGATGTARRLPADDRRHFERPPGRLPSAVAAPGMRLSSFHRRPILTRAIAIIARYFSGGLDDPAVVGESLRGVHLYDGEEIESISARPDHPGQIYETMQLHHRFLVEPRAGSRLPSRPLT